MGSFGRVLTVQQILDSFGEDHQPKAADIRNLIATLMQGGASPSFINATLTGLLFESATDGMAARVGGGQALATPMTTELNRFTTVTNIGDSGLLPPSAPGLTIIVINHGANAMQVYGAGTDTIDDVATATGVSQMAGSNVIYSCTTAGAWYSNGIGTGYAGQFPTLSYTNNIAAFATGGQASATLLTACINRVTTVTNANDSVKMPVSAPGMQITVSNATATNSMNLFPNTGDQINALGANAAFAILAGKTATLTCAVGGQWHAVLSA